MRPVRLEVWSDYLCPWCYNAAHRLQALEAEFGSDLLVDWRSYLLRPRPAARSRDAFVAYTRSWRRPAAEADAPRFQVWQGDAGPPSHSVPPHRVAKAAARLGPEAFRSLHPRLLRGYFEESRDISDSAVLRALWAEAGLPADAFETAAEPGILEQIGREHREAQERGITGVPAVAVQGHEGFVMGAQPLAVTRRWIHRLLDGVLD